MTTEIPELSALREALDAAASAADDDALTPSVVPAVCAAMDAAVDGGHGRAAMAMLEDRRVAASGVLLQAIELAQFRANDAALAVMRGEAIRWTRINTLGDAGYSTELGVRWSRTPAGLLILSPDEGGEAVMATFAGEIRAFSRQAGAACEDGAGSVFGTLDGEIRAGQVAVVARASGTITITNERVLLAMVEPPLGLDARAERSQPLVGLSPRSGSVLAFSVNRKDVDSAEFGPRLETGRTGAFSLLGHWPFHVDVVGSVAGDAIKTPRRGEVMEALQSFLTGMGPAPHHTANDVTAVLGDVRVPPPTEVADADATQVCGGCGEGLRPGVRFCARCGSHAQVETSTEAAVGDSPTPRRCGACGTALRGGVAFCPRCGHPSTTAVAGAFKAPEVVETWAPPAAPATTSGGRRVRVLPLVAALVAVAGAVGGSGYWFLLRDSAPRSAPAKTGAIASANDEGAVPPEATTVEAFVPPGAVAPEVDTNTNEVPNQAPARRRETVNLTQAFIAQDAEDPRDVCFGPGARPTGVAYMDVRGSRVRRDLIQCGSRRGPGDANGVYRFRSAQLLLEDGVLITGVDGLFAMDESATSQRASRVQWVVQVGGTVICRVSATLRGPGRCRLTGGPVEVRTGDQLVITQSVIRAVDRGLWAGIVGGRLRLSVPDSVGPAPATVPPDPTPGDVGSPRGDLEVEAALDSIFLSIKAGDYSRGAEAEDLYRELMDAGHPLRGNAAFNAGVLSYATGDCLAAAAAFEDSARAPGTSRQLAIRNDALTAAASGCERPVEDIIGA